MKLIDISTPKYPDTYAMVDDEDFDRLNQWKWHRGPSGYVARHIWSRGRSVRFRMHREILNCPGGYEVDHINGNPLDNRKSNLRICTKSENQWNKGLGKDNTSGFKGVSAERGKWQARIRVKTVRRHLGLYETPLEAALAYDAAALELHGEFAKTNRSMGLIPCSETPTSLAPPHPESDGEKGIQA
jgi:hypothetical protein